MSGPRFVDRLREQRRLAGDQPVWEEDGRDWPLREASRFVEAAGLGWHLQELGRGPDLLLVHGTGAATHSWRGLAPLLAERFRVIAPDLPGHGFTDPLPPAEVSLPGMAAALHRLLQALGAAPALVVGHSAGAAILLRLSLDGRMAPKGVVSLNGALLPLRGLAGHLFSPLAKLLVALPLVPRLLARQAQDPEAVARVLKDTGSAVDPLAVELYGRLVRRPGHVAAALRMMAGWNLQPLLRDLPRLGPPLLLVVGGDDRTVPPSQARRVQLLLPSARIVRLPGLGHLAHEERPDEVAKLILGFAREVGALAPENGAGQGPR